MGNFYQPDGSDLQSLTQTNPQHRWDFFYSYLLAKQRNSQRTEHNKPNLRFCWGCREGRTNSKLLPQRNEPKPKGKACCNEAVFPIPGLSTTPLGGCFTRHRVTEFQLLLWTLDLYRIRSAVEL